MHQIASEQPLLDLKPEFDAERGASIEEVLERARLRVAQREQEDSDHRFLPNLAPPERAWQRAMWFCVAIVVVWMHFYVVRSFLAPAHPGVDQNGYQVGGKMFAATFSTGFKPSNPYSYVGWMWVMTPDGWMYPKYPLGIPVLDALCIWLAPTFHQGVVASYFVSPVCTVLASAAMFLMLRMVASSFAAVVGTILIASNPVALVLANNSNSHAAALAFVSWGILFLMWWMRYGGWWRGLIAGFLLGYAMTIRYTEGLLVLPIAAAMLTSIKYERASKIRWWAISTWVLLGVTAVILRSATTIPVGGWRTWTAACAFAILVTVIARVRSENRNRRTLLFELLRSIICAGILFFLLRFDLPVKGWKSLVDRSIVLNLIIVASIGAIPLFYSIRWYAPRTYLRPLYVLIGWLIPVIALITFNKHAMGSWTGYDTTNESEGFSWIWFSDKWDFMISQVYNTGLFFVISLGIAGMFFLYRKSARVALVMTLWFVPGVLLYTSYYWGRQGANGVGYLRFFLTLFPPIVFCATWMLDDMARRGVRRGSIAGPLACGIVVSIAAAMNLYSVCGPLERDYTINANLAASAEHVLSKTKDNYPNDPTRRPLLFGELRGFLNYIQYAGNYECYSNDAFTQQGGRRMWQNQDPDMPRPLQQARVEEMRKVYAGKSETDLWNEGNKILNEALAQNRHVYAALPTAMMIGFKSRISIRDYQITTLERWREPVTMSDDAKRALTALGPGLGMQNRALPQNWELIEITKKTTPPAPPPRANPAPPQRANPGQGRGNGFAARANGALRRATPATTQATTQATTRPAG